MAFDEALLEFMPHFRRPVLRFYSWTEPAASFGYFQKYTEVAELTALRPLVRRPTGGGIVPHDADWTYSLVFPPNDDWYSLPARDSYCTMHRWLQLAFAKLGLRTELAPASFKPALGQCFIGHELADLLYQGRKIAGAAQRRRKDGLLIQGSIQPPLPAARRPEWETAMREVVPTTELPEWRPFPPDAALQQRALDLQQTKYSRDGYHQQR